MSEELIINFTPTGMIPTKEMTPHIPVDVSEIIDQVLEPREIRISMVHLHARDPETKDPTYSREIYGKIIEGIRKHEPQLVVCVSLSGRNFTELEKRADPLYLEGELKPDMGSLTLSSLNFNRVASMNSPQMIQDLAAIMMEKGIVPELEAFDIGMINYANYLEKKNLIRPPHYFNLLLGNIACAQADLMQAGIMIRELPENSLWSLAGIGNAQLKMNSIAIAVGGGVRVGLEDNIWWDEERTRLASNSDLLKRIHTLAEANSRDLMRPAKLRERLNLQNGDGLYGRRAS